MAKKITRLFCSLSFLSLVPSASPSAVKLHLINDTTALLQWHQPSPRDLHGDLKGYKVLIESVSSGNETVTTSSSNFTLDPESNSLVLYNVSTGVEYTVKVAAYNRQG